MNIPALFRSSAAALLLSACQGMTPPMATVPHVDLPRFMGDWYVIANIPTLIEKGAHNAVESYRLDPDGTIATTFTFRAGGFDGEVKRYTPRGYVIDPQSNAVWGMQFIWPIKADYRITYLSADYRIAVIARERRDYVWFLARTPAVSDEAYGQLLQHAAGLGYDIARIRRVPQQWN